MTTIEEVCILMLLRRRRKQRQQQRRRWYVRPLNMSRNDNGEYVSLVLPMREMDEAKHHEYFRMSVRRFDDLLRRIVPLIRHENTHSEPVDPAQRLAVTLRYLATGVTFRALAASYKLGGATVSYIVPEVCRAIWIALKDKFVAFPDTAHWVNIKTDFLRLWNYPNCLGAIDCKHVRVRAPLNSGTAVDNCKGYLNFILMAVCDARYRFTVVDIGAYGPDSDAEVFARSHFGSQLVCGEMPLLPPCDLPGSELLSPHVFVADEAFPLKVNLMRPYLGASLASEQRVYNYRHSQARHVVDNAFGILAARWRVFERAMNCSLDKAQDITRACIALHNYLCASDSTESDGAKYVTSALVDDVNSPGEWRRTVEGDSNLTNPGRLSADQATEVGVQVREQFKDYFQTEVAFQDAVFQQDTIN